jgi:hypothetical protein
MAYFIFLKYLDSLEDFRKNPHVKIPPKYPCANFQSLGIFKNLIFNQKRIFLQLSVQSAQRPASPSDLLAHTAQPVVFFLLPHRSGARKPPPPAGLTPPPWSALTTSTGGKITAASLLHFPIKRCPPPLQSSVTRAFNLGALKLLQRWPLKAPSLPRLASAL